MDTAIRGLWLRWLPTFLGFIVGGELAIVVVDRVDSIGTAVIGGAIAGAVIGGGQWLVLRRRLPQAGWWITASAAGQAIGLAAGAGPTRHHQNRGHQVSNRDGGRPRNHPTGRHS